MVSGVVRWWPGFVVSGEVCGVGLGGVVFGRAVTRLYCCL